MVLNHRKTLAAIIAAAGLAGLVQGAHAENDTAERFEREQLQAFVVVVAEMRAIQNQYAQRVTNAADEEEAARLRNEANREMRTVVKDSPLSIEQYNGIARAVRKDPELRRRLQRMAK